MTYVAAIGAAFGAGRSGQLTFVGYKVIDYAGTTRIARITTGITERTDAAGNAVTGMYEALPTFDTAWGIVRVIWDITGIAGVVAEDVVDTAAAGSAIVAIQADTDDMQTRIPAALVGGRMDSSVGSNLDKTGYALSSAGQVQVANTTLDTATVDGRAVGSYGALIRSNLNAAVASLPTVDDILDEQIGDGTITMRQALRAILATQVGKLSGAATTTITIRNSADTANVVVATVDANGNRSEVVLTP